MGGMAKTVDLFIGLARDDICNPTTSEFLTQLPTLRTSINSLTENVFFDAEGLQRLKKSFKSLHTTAQQLNQSEGDLVLSLDNLAGLNATNSLTQDYDPVISAAFLKFCVIFRDLSALTKGLVQSIDNNLVFPVDNLLKNDLSSKADIKRGFDKASKDCEIKISRLEKERKQSSKDVGWTRSEISPVEFTEHLEKERQVLHLEICDILVRLNRVNSKKGVDLLQHLVDYYQTQQSYFEDGLKIVKEYSSYVTTLIKDLQRIRILQDEERKRISDLKEEVKAVPLSVSLDSEKLLAVVGAERVTSGSATSPNKILGSAKVGYLNKKSDGKMRRVWQKRRCEVKDGYLRIYHYDEQLPPTKIILATAEVKVSEDKRCFNVVCYNRTYHFQGEDEQQSSAWVSVLLNGREEAQTNLFQHPQLLNGNVQIVKGPQTDEERLVDRIRRLPGNQQCCDCGASKDVTWVAVNLGTLYCIDCSGFHRELGVHVSRIQSLTLDNLSTTNLLVASSVGNKVFNAVFEATVHANIKLKPTALVAEKKTYIQEKYVQKRFVKSSKDSQHLIVEAIRDCDMTKLLQAYGVNQKLNTLVPEDSTVGSTESSLHYLVRHSGPYVDCLPLMAFILHNDGDVNVQNENGETAIHVAVEAGRIECLRLLLLGKNVNLSLTNSVGLTQLQLAQNRGSSLCEKLIEEAISGNRTFLEHFQISDVNEDLSDNDFDESNGKPLSEPAKALGPPPKPPTLQRTCTKLKAAEARMSHPLQPAVSDKATRSRLSLLQPHSRNPVVKTSSESSSDGLESHSVPTGCQNSPPLPARKMRHASGGSNNSSVSHKKCRALYDCNADNPDELSFQEGEVIVVTNPRLYGDDNWMEGYVDNSPDRHGVFPACFVTFV